MTHPASVRRLAINSAFISGFTGLGVLIGLAIDILIASRYQLSNVTDAYIVAITVPVAILAAITGSIQSVVVVALVQTRTGRDSETYTDLFSTLVNLTILTGGLLAIIGYISSELLINILAPGLDLTSQLIAIQMSRVLFLGVPAELLIEVFRANLYAYNRFIVAAASNFIPGLITLIIMLLLPRTLPVNLAWAISLGNWSGLLLTGAAFIGISVNYRLVIAWRDPSLRRLGNELLPSLAGLTVRQGVTLAERWFGSFLPTGSVAALGYASKITQVLAGTLLSAISVASLPELAKALGSRLRHQVVEQWRRLLALSIFIGGFAAFGIIIVRRPLVSILFERGFHQLELTEFVLITSVLTAYALCLIPLGPFRAQQSYLFAARRPLIVALLLLIATSITIILDWPLVNWLGAAGLGISFFIGVFIAMLVGFVIINKDIGQMVDPGK